MYVPNYPSLADNVWSLNTRSFLGQNQCWVPMKSVRNIVHSLCFCLLQCDCAKQLEWFKIVKNTQLSAHVVDSAFKHIEILRARYHYVLRTDQTGTSLSMKDVLNAVDQCGDVHERWKVYTLDELRDLEGKLVLIKGNYVEEKTELVNSFLEVSTNGFCA